MSVGLLIITHGEIGQSLLATATRIFGGRCPLRAAVLPVYEEVKRDELRKQAAQLLEQLDSGGGVLVLTDLFGATPANIAQELRERGETALLTGMNLPMLVRLFNYADLSLEALSAKAASGGRDGVILCGNPGQ